MSRRGLAAATVSALCALLIAGCSQQSGTALARQACDRVHASIAAYEASIHATSSFAKNRDLQKAKADIQAAEPIAAAATSADGQWNALMTTLNEIGQVDEGHLVTALEDQCAVADSNQPGIPTVPNAPG